jgi:hypothetical protein
VTSPQLKGIEEGKINATQTRPLASAIACWISYWVHPAVFPATEGTAGTVWLDKTTGILSVEPTIVAASRHRHDDVSGGGGKKLREGWGIFQGGF